MNLPVIVRTATEADLSAINAIYNHYVVTSTCTYQLEPDSEAERAAWFAAHGERYPVLVAECDGDVRGWASLTPFRPRPGYRFTVEDSVYIRADCHGKGLGKQLLANLVDRANALGFRSIIAQISADQAASVSLHHAFGFERVGCLQDVGYKFGRWLDVILLQRLLERPD